MLDYASRAPRYEETPLDRLWRYRRCAYYLGHVGLMLLIVFWLGPNLILYRRVAGPPPSYFVSATPTYARVVAAVKAHQRDIGSLPFYPGEISKQYLPDREHWFGNYIMGGKITFHAREMHAVLVYDFNPLTEGWSVFSPRYDGPIPAPLVQALPTTRPATTQSNSNTQ